MTRKIELFPTPHGLILSPKTVAVVIDVFRTTTTLTTALANGCRFILPAADVEQAVRLIEPYRQGEALLGGERDGVKIEGFHLGNSPVEYAPEVVGNRIVVFTSTNGTAALLRCTDARTVLLGSFLNVNAIADRLADEESVALVCAGNAGRLALEDFVCAGALCTRLGRGAVLNDAAIAAQATWRSLSRTLVTTLTGTVHAQHLRALGAAADLAHAIRLNATPLVPVFRDGRITLESEPASPSPQTPLEQRT